MQRQNLDREPQPTLQGALDHYTESRKGNLKMVTASPVSGQHSVRDSSLLLSREGEWERAMMLFQVFASL